MTLRGRRGAPRPAPAPRARLVAPLAPAPGRDDDLGLLEQAHVLVVLKPLALQAERGARAGTRAMASAMQRCGLLRRRPPGLDRTLQPCIPAGPSSLWGAMPLLTPRSPRAAAPQLPPTCGTYTLYLWPHLSRKADSALTAAWRCSVTPLTSALASYSSLPMKVTSYGRSDRGGMGHRLWSLLRRATAGDGWWGGGRGKVWLGTRAHGRRGAAAQAHTRARRALGESAGGGRAGGRGRGGVEPQQPQRPPASPCPPSPSSREEGVVAHKAPGPAALDGVGKAHRHGQQHLHLWGAKGVGAGPGGSEGHSDERQPRLATARCHARNRGPLPAPGPRAAPWPAWRAPTAAPASSAGGRRRAPAPP